MSAASCRECRGSGASNRAPMPAAAPDRPRPGTLAPARRAERPLPRAVRLRRIDGELADGQALSLMRLRYVGMAHTWGFALYLASSQSTKTPSCPPAASSAPPKTPSTAPPTSTSRHPTSDYRPNTTPRETSNPRRTYAADHLACSLRILLGHPVVRSALVAAFAVDHWPGLGPVLRSPGTARPGPGAFRRPGGRARPPAETAKTQPDPAGAEPPSRPGALVPGPAQVTGQDRGQPQLGAGGHDQRGPPAGGLGAGEVSGIKAQAGLAEAVEVLLIEPAQVFLPQQIHIRLGRPAVPQPQGPRVLAATGQALHSDLNRAVRDRQLLLPGVGRPAGPSDPAPCAGPPGPHPHLAVPRGLARQPGAGGMVAARVRQREPLPVPPRRAPLPRDALRGIGVEHPVAAQPGQHLHRLPGQRVR